MIRAAIGLLDPEAEQAFDMVLGGLDLALDQRVIVRSGDAGQVELLLQNLNVYNH
ncbi:hypothetical protein D3C71_1992430 [compost metagenome]